MNEPGDKKISNVWVNIFDLASYTEDDLSQILIGVRQEIEHTKAKLTEIYEVPIDLYSPTLDLLRDVCSPTLLNVPWSHHKGNISSSENQKVLQWIAWTLRNEKEGVLEKEEIIALENELRSFEEMLNDCDITPYLRGFINRNIKSIKDALRNYPIQGVDPFIHSIEKVGGALRGNAAKIHKEFNSASPEAKGILQKMANMVTKLSNKADELNKIKEAGEGIVSLGTSVKDAITACGGFVNEIFPAGSTIPA